MSEGTNTVAHELTDRTAQAAMWRFAGSVVGAICELGFGILLARLLTPTDFGVMALALVVLGAARPIVDLGIGDALVQRAELTDRHVRTAFTFSVILGLTIAVAMWAAAPLSAAVMRDARVSGLMRVLAIGFAFRGTAVVADALMRRQLEFRRQSLIETGSAVAGFGLAVGLALSGYGVWSLACGAVLQGALASAAQVAAMRHPVAPLLAPRELTDLFRFGLPAHASGCINYIALNGDNFVVGRWIGAAGLGLYSRAYSLMNLPFTFAARVMSRVLFPVFAQIQRDPERLRRGFLLSTQLTAMIAAPCMATIGVAAPHLVDTLYGSQWTGAVIPLQILCVAGYFRALYHLGGVVAQGVGRVYSELWRQMLYAGLVLAGALVGTSHGLPGVAVGVGVAIVYMFAASAQLALHATGTPWSSYLRVQLSAIVTAAVTCGIALSVRMSLETYHVSSVVITLAILIATAVPWAVGLLWNLSEPGFEPVCARLPGVCVRLVDALRTSRMMSARSTGRRAHESASDSRIAHGDSANR